MSENISRDCSLRSKYVNILSLKSFFILWNIWDIYKIYEKYKKIYEEKDVVIFNETNLT